MNSQLPSYYDAQDVGRVFPPRLQTVTEAARGVKLRPASKDDKKTLLVGIDLQVDFIAPEIRQGDAVIQPAGTLLVKGAVDDVRRLIELIYLHPEEISGMLWTLDQHLPFQIFYPRWWRDSKGNIPAPFTQITEEAVKAGDFRPAIDKDWSVNYPSKLKATGQSPLFLWPDHCMIGTTGAALMPALYEAIHWLSIVRSIQPTYLFKGTVPQTEHYGPFCPCVEVPNHPQGGLNTVMLDQMASNDRIVVAGEAEDFCVHEGMRQTLEYFGQKHPDAFRKMTFLSDCTSMVFPDNRPDADQFLQVMAGQGIQVTTTDKLFA
jgi:nicotinamidase-related amidase